MRCQSVLIKFMDRNVPQQEVRALQLTGARYITMSFEAEGDKFLCLVFNSLDDRPIKVIMYNLSDIKEFVCEGSISYEV